MVLPLTKALTEWSAREWRRPVRAAVTAARYSPRPPAEMAAMEGEDLGSC